MDRGGALVGFRPRRPLRRRAPGRGARRRRNRRKGFQRDRTWSEAYEAGKAVAPVVDIDWVPEVHAALIDSYTAWVHSADLWRRLADCPVPMRFVAAGDDIRPSWPLEQLAALIPGATFSSVPGVPHDFWLTRPEVWTSVVTDALSTV